MRGYSFHIEVTQDQLDSVSLGACLTCGELSEGVEPDACNYTCEHCGETNVFGLANLLMMDKLVIS